MHFINPGVIINLCKRKLSTKNMLKLFWNITSLPKSKLILALIVLFLISGGIVGIKIAGDIINNQNLLKPSPSVDSESTLDVATNSSPTPTIIPSPANVQSTPRVNIKIVYKGTYTHLGQTSEVILNIPSLGGDITGTVSGACNGPVEGKYSGDKISGSANGSCKIAGVDVDSTATYDGSIDTVLKKVNLSFKGIAGVLTLNDSMQLQGL